MARKWLYATETPGCDKLRGRRHCYEAVLIAETGLQQRRWLRSLQRSLAYERASHGANAVYGYPAWRRSYRLGQLQGYALGGELYVTTEALCMLIRDHSDPVGFAAYSVGIGAAAAGCARELLIRVDAVWINRKERGQALSYLLAQRIADTAWALADPSTLKQAASGAVNFELSMPHLTRSGYYFLQTCREMIEDRCDLEPPGCRVEAIVDVTPAALELINLYVPIAASGWRV